jgi:hypothetical protein
MIDSTKERKAVDNFSAYALPKIPMHIVPVTSPMDGSDDSAQGFPLFV